jgi:predicted LPLAT superfamily acyltransferase
MYPVTFFYFIFAKNVKDSLKIYYKHLNIELTNKIYYEHLRIFAITMLDRFITKVDKGNYTFLYDDKGNSLEMFRKGTILLFSHFGGWAASSNVSRLSNKINIVMQESLKDAIKEIEESIDSKTNVSIIDLKTGPIIVSIQIANALMNEEIVAIMGDRASNQKAVIEVDFLNEKAYFNKNPFQIAYKMDKPIMIYFVVLVGIQTYKIEYLRVDVDKTKAESEAVFEAVKIYVKEYESIIKRYPNQWLNFYDFWDKEFKS